MRSCPARTAPFVCACALLVTSPALADQPLIMEIEDRASMNVGEEIVVQRALRCSYDGDDGSVESFTLKERALLFGADREDQGLYVEDIDMQHVDECTLTYLVFSDHVLDTPRRTEDRRERTCYATTRPAYPMHLASVRLIATLDVRFVRSGHTIAMTTNTSYSEIAQGRIEARPSLRRSALGYRYGLDLWQTRARH